MPPQEAGIPTSSPSLNSAAKNVSTEVSTSSRRASKKATSNKKHDGERTPVNEVGRQSAVLVRKRLPWLDGKPGYIPGQFESQESLVTGDATGSPPPVPDKDRVPPNLPSAPSLGIDPALRAVGSTPSLRKRARSADFKSLSLNSQPRPGIKPVTSKNDARRALGMLDEQQQGTNYASSEYSASPSSERSPMPATLPRKDPSSYERLVVRHNSHRQGSRVPYRTANPWFQSQLDLPLDYQISPGHSPNDQKAGSQHADSPRHHVPGSHHRNRRNSCKSCGQDTKIRRPPQAKQLHRRTIPAPPPEPPPLLPPAPPPIRRPTLFAMPTHLLPSSSSSSYDATSQAAAVQASLPEQLRASPSAPRPSLAQDPRRESQSLNRAVTGLETLMEEALSAARNAAQTSRNDEIANILDSATLALRKASTVHGQMDTGRMSHPLVLSPTVSERDSERDSADSDSDTSSIRSTRHSVDTTPTLLTRSAQSSQQPLLASQGRAGGRSSVSLKRQADDGYGFGRGISPDRQSMSVTPPRLYQPPSADSIVRDFAYARAKTAKAQAARQLSRSYGAASDYYGDTGESVSAQPGVRPSLSTPMIGDNPLPPLPLTVKKSSVPISNDLVPPKGGRQARLRQVESVPTNTIPPRMSSRNFEIPQDPEDHPRHRKPRHQRPHLSDFFESSYYHEKHKHDREPRESKTEIQRGASGVTETRYDPNIEKRESVSKYSTRYSGPTTSLERNFSLRHPRRKHISLRKGQGLSLGRYHRRQPIAREWGTHRKRITATIACLNTVFVGLIAGIYAGEVPKIQYYLADTKHQVILGNVVLFGCLGFTTLIFWPLPLLHGRKPYTLAAFALMLPLMFPQALAVSGYRSPYNPIYRCGLLIPRAFQGIAMGFANINFLPTLFDLFGASLMSDKPHQEIVVYDDVRRQGGGIGVWLGIWSFCFVGSMSIGFCVGAVIISDISPAWGFYLIVILLAFFLLVNVVAPETRRAPYRRSIAQYIDEDEKLKRRVARGEVKLHISNEGPMWWYQEVWAGLILTMRMIFQPGFFILASYLAWMYAQVTLVILFLGALLSRDYQWQPHFVGLAVLSVAIGAFLAVPLSKANLFSRSRDHPQRTDSMTMRHGGRVTWSSHMLRRCVFTLTLPFAALAYTLSSLGPSVSWTTPTIFCGLVGFLSNLAIAECVGLIMETFDTCDLQPGVNQKHRLQSMAEVTRRRRTNYSSFPRICAGFFASQSLGFMLSAAATGVSGDITRAVGAQTATAIVAAILLGLTVLFIIVLWRWRELQVIPNHIFGTKKGSIAWGPGAEDPEWKPVIIGNPSGKMRRMSLLELGSLSRWTEIRKLNKLTRN